MKRILTKEELNQKAIEVVQSLNDNGYFETIEIVDTQITKNVDPSNYKFYLSAQDQLKLAWGEITSAYYELKANLKTYVVVRKTQIKIELTINKEKVPGNEILEDSARAEIADANYGVILLEGWLARIEGAIQTARSHIYSDKNDRNEKENKRGE